MQQFVVCFKPFSFFNSCRIPTVLRVNGPMVCCGFKLRKTQISVEQFKSFFEAQTGWLWGIQRRVKLVKHCFAMVLQWWWWGRLDVSVNAKVFTTVSLLLHKNRSEDQKIVSSPQFSWIQRNWKQETVSCLKSQSWLDLLFSWTHYSTAVFLREAVKNYLSDFFPLRGGGVPPHFR